VTDELKEFWESVKKEIPYIKNWGLELEDHVDTKGISMGQKQLLSALRSCFLQKPVVLFDEISSGMDSEVELALRKMVLLIQKYSLTFIVAHRIETITSADQILVMDAGRIIARGSHQELCQSSKKYQEFINELRQLV
jgi:ATP-binding cassette subfamily B multidrug efflux pump